MSIDAPGEPSSVLGHPDLRRYTFARFLAAVATQVQTVAVGWQIFSATGNPLDLGLVGLSQFLTYVLLAVAAAALLGLSLAGIEDPAPIFGVMVLFGVARAFNMPTGQAL